MSPIISIVWMLQCLFFSPLYLIFESHRARIFLKNKVYCYKTHQDRTVLTSTARPAQNTEIFLPLLIRGAAPQEVRHTVLTAAAVASFRLNGMYTPQGKIAKAFTNLFSVLAYDTYFSGNCHSAWSRSRQESTKLLVVYSPWGEALPQTECRGTAKQGHSKMTQH